MRRLIAAALLLASFGALAESETLYVRTTADCATNGCGSTNGSSFANAYNGFADVAFSAVDGTANTVDPEDTLVICARDGAEFTTADADTATVFIAPSANVSGTSTSAYTTFSGDCSAQAGYSSDAKLNGGGSYDRGIDSGSSARAYWKITHLEITGFDAYGVLSQGLDSDVGAWRIDDVYLHDNRGASAQGMDLRGSNYLLVEVTVANSGNDNIFYRGAGFSMLRGSSSNPSQDSVGGDGLQCSTTCDNFLIVDVDFSANIDIKQCVIIQATNIGGSVIGSSCEGPSSTANSHAAFYFDGAGTVYFLGNFVKKSNYMAFATNGTTLVAESNIGTLLNSYGIQLGSAGTNNSTIVHNSIYGAARCIDTDTATAGTSTIKNNLTWNCGVYGVGKNAGDTESNNATYLSTIPCVQAGSATSCGAGNVTSAPLLQVSSAPTTEKDFRPSTNSPLGGAGAALSAGLNDYFGYNFESPPTIGAIRGPSPRIDLSSTNRVDMTASNRVDMSTTNRIAMSATNRLLLQ